MTPGRSIPPDLKTAGSARQLRPRRRTFRLVMLAAICVAIAIVIVGIRSRQQALANLQQVASARTIPVVDVALPQPPKGPTPLELPGRLEASARASLFARVNGYIAKWNFDIGAKVKAGEVLAEIEAPDLDQQLYQAQSDLATAQANEELAAITNQRYQALLPNATVSRQAPDEKASARTPRPDLHRERHGRRRRDRYRDGNYAHAARGRQREWRTRSGIVCECELRVPPANGTLTVPASAIIFDRTGLRVAVVSKAGQVELRKITIARDLGNVVEISSGITSEDRIVQSPPDDLVDGDRFQIKNGSAEHPSSSTAGRRGI
ncbi:MAG: biotin/lipoyl-binding protein [Hyphomicrobiales bacterium]|nr:MAG: biotin/lipoyl-binding protein [Hyphomicrobiales bacterium]